MKQTNGILTLMGKSMLQRKVMEHVTLIVLLCSNVG